MSLSFKAGCNSAILQSSFVSQTRSTLEYLYGLQTFGMKLGLRNIRTLLHFCHDPQKQFRSVHVAGTNGKGSTSAMIAAVLQSAGYRTGLYTSPHLVKFNERIRVNGKMISDSDLVRYAALLRPQIDRFRATFFEATTAIAFKYFADKKVDIAVIETGLGEDSMRPMFLFLKFLSSRQSRKTIPSISADRCGKLLMKKGESSNGVKRVLLEL